MQYTVSTINKRVVKRIKAFSMQDALSEAKKEFGYSYTITDTAFMSRIGALIVEKEVR